MECRDPGGNDLEKEGHKNEVSIPEEGWGPHGEETQKERRGNPHGEGRGKQKKKRPKVQLSRITTKSTIP